MSNSRYFEDLLCAGVMALVGGAVCAQDYPVKPIRIFTTAAGGGGDFVARQIAPGVSTALGQPVLIENRPQGLIAAEQVSKMPPDGYALTLQGSSFWTTPLLRKVPYDVMGDFAPITFVERTVNVLIVHPALPVKTVKELIALAKARPGELNYATSAGVGSTSHIATELFSHMAGVKLVHIPYKGNAPAITAMLSGEVQMMLSDLSVAAPHMKLGRVKPLAVTTIHPTALVPGVPMVAATLPGFDMVGMTSLFAPAKTPVAIINRWQQEVARVLNQADIKDRFLRAGTEAVSSTPDELAAKMKLDMVRMAKVIKDVGIKAE
jgi:tripartite-type tricarboxylate transporter receptor subunit TctC